MQESGMTSGLMVNVESSPQQHTNYFFGFENRQLPRHADA